MARSSTDRLKLFIESDDELIDQFEYNWPILDKYSDSLLVDDGVTPPDSDLYEGCLVAEKTSGKLWMAVKDPSTGLFVKSWVSYPFNAVGYYNGPFDPIGGEKVFTGDIAAQRVNSTFATDFSGGKMKVPVNGIYHWWMLSEVAGTVANARISLQGWINGVWVTDLTHNGQPGANTSYHSIETQYFKAGDLLSWAWWRSGGSVVSANIYMGLTLVSPVM